MPPMKRIGILVKAESPDTKVLLKELVPWLRAQGKDPLLDPATAKLVGETASYPKKDLAALADMLVVLGGDGTMLAAARLVEDRPIPILGVNTGGLGFLTAVTRDELFKALEQVFANTYAEEERLMLRSRIVRMGKQVAAAAVLNDVALSKGALSHMVQLEISIDGQFVTGLRGDGLIISTPTGSTAYSMAAGGPILNPAVHALILTPISPHTLTNRPIVIPQEAHVEVVLVSKDEGAMVTFDGQAGITLQPRDLIEVRASEKKTRLIRFADRTYYDMLRNKLKWGESKRDADTFAMDFFRRMATSISSLVGNLNSSMARRCPSSCSISLNASRSSTCTASGCRIFTKASSRFSLCAISSAVKGALSARCRRTTSLHHSPSRLATPTSPSLALRAHPQRKTSGMTAPVASS